MRKIVLDTETTGLDVRSGHRVIEIGCVELIERKLTGRTFHAYLNPERKVDEGAIAVHGITDAFLADKPKFSQIFDEFFEFVNGAELVIHNATFDLGFLNQEFALLSKRNGREKSVGSITDYCTVVDTLLMAREKHPAQRNNLDALCKRYGIDNSKRELHGALLDAEILADVYLAMTGGQVSFFLDEQENVDSQDEAVTEGEKKIEYEFNSTSYVEEFSSERRPLKVIYATQAELILHAERLDLLRRISGKSSLWESLM